MGMNGAAQDRPVVMIVMAIFRIGFCNIGKLMDVDSSPVWEFGNLWIFRILAIFRAAQVRAQDRLFLLGVPMFQHYALSSYALTSYHRKEPVRFDSFRLRTLRNYSFRFGSEFEFPGSTQFGLRFSDASWPGSVRFGSVRPVRFGFLFTYTYHDIIILCLGVLKRLSLLRHH